MSNRNIPEDIYVAEGARIVGDVTIGEDTSIWYNAVIRADRAPVTIGKCSNVQDNAVIHVGSGYPTVVGDYVTIGHSAIVHGATVGDGTTIGMGAILMNGSKVGKNCMIGAGAIVPQGKEIPDNSLALGSPARILRQLTEEEIQTYLKNTTDYVEEAKEALKEV